MNLPDEAGLCVAKAALERWRDMPPIPFHVARWDAYVLVGVLQLLTRQPDIPPRVIQTMTAIGRTIQEHIADDPDIYTFMEAGWDNPLDSVEERIR